MSSEPIPAEFRGLARQFWRHATAEDEVFGPGLDRIVAPVLSRMRKYPRRDLRDGTLDVLGEQWAKLPDGFRIALRTRIDKRGRRGDIIDLRVRPTRLAISDWEELAVDVDSLCLDFPFRRGGKIPQTFASVGFHALARRFQRCPDHSRAALMSDFSALIKANVNDETKFPTGELFDIQTPRGAWRGVTGPVTDLDGTVAVQFVVRTFVDNV